jgi:cobalamin biosynthesis protein CbiD
METESCSYAISVKKRLIIMETMQGFGKSKERLLKNLNRVSEAEIQEISDFAEFVLKKRLKNKTKRITLNPREDPIFKLIGIADVECFSGTIDQELYG